MRKSPQNIQTSLRSTVFVTLLAAVSLASDPLANALTQLKSPDVTKRRVAAQELVMLRNPASAPALMQALSDKNDTVRTLAVRALGYMRWKEAVPRLIELLETDKSKEVRNEAALSLRFINDPSSLPALQKAVKDPEDTVRITAILALASLRDRSSLPALSEAAQDKAPNIRRNAVYALGQVADPSSAPALKNALKDPDAAVRANAAQALVNLPGLPGREELKEALKDPDLLVQLSAARSLAIQGDGAGLTVALANAHSTRREVQLLAIDTLGWIKDAAAIKTLETLAQAQDPAVKQAAQQSLTRALEKRK